MSDSPQNVFRHQDKSPDELFYLQLSFVTHIDEGAIAVVEKRGNP